MDRSFPGKEGAVGHCCGWVGRLVAGRAGEEARAVVSLRVRVKKGLRTLPCWHNREE